MKHTKEPWEARRDRWHYASLSSIFAKGDYTSIAELGGKPLEEVEANAKRIVLCVNACTGITNEALEENIIKHAMADFMQDSNHFGETPVFYDLPLMTDEELEGRKG